jgi:hypothetical protein
MTRRTGADATGRREPPGQAPRPRSVATPWLRSAAALAALLLLSACAQRGSATPAPSPSASPSPSVDLPDDGAAVVLRVGHVGGFVAPSSLVSRLPRYSLYADGRLITDGPVDLRYPGPALPNVQVQQLDAATVQALADRAVAAGVGETTDLGSPPIADMPSTRFTLTTAEGTVAREVYALVEHVVEGDGAEMGLTREQVDGRTRLRELLAALFDVGQQPTPDGRAPVEPYVPTAVAAIATPWIDPEDDLTHPELPWPGPPLPGEPVGGPLDVGCVVATGVQVSAVLAVAATANAATPWASGGTRWSVAFRPLLPDESGCADLLD